MEEKPIAVFQECVKRRGIHQRDAHRMDYAREWEQEVSSVLIIEKDDGNDRGHTGNFFYGDWGRTGVPEKKENTAKVIKEEKI